nr:hypothetical protein [Cacao mild mosaic virus]
MSERWERAIAEWYDKSRTSDLEYLDLASSHKVSNSDLANNIAVVYDRLNLLSRVHIKDCKKILEEIDGVKRESRKLRQEVSNLTITVLENKPITKAQVLEITEQISKQPKEIEEQALALLTKVNQKLAQVEALVAKLEAWTNT